MEPSEDKLRKAGHLMAQKLAGSLALVSCKEPLKSNLGGHLRTTLIDYGFSEQVISEQVLSIIVADNVEVACSAIEKAAMERAVVDVDEGFATSYEVRRRHRELRNGQAFWDPSAPPTNFSVVLPDPLRIKATGLQPHQVAVYEDFCEYYVDYVSALLMWNRSPRPQAAALYYEPTWLGGGIYAR
jgi:CCR4-NOT transcription complex subunit 1